MEKRNKQCTFSFYHHEIFYYAQCLKTTYSQRDLDTFVFCILNKWPSRLKQLLANNNQQQAPAKEYYHPTNHTISQQLSINIKYQLWLLRRVFNSWYYLIDGLTGHPVRIELMLVVGLFCSLYDNWSQLYLSGCDVHITVTLCVNVNISTLQPASLPGQVQVYPTPRQR